MPRMRLRRVRLLSALRYFLRKQGVLDLGLPPAVPLVVLPLLIANVVRYQVLSRNGVGHRPGGWPDLTKLVRTVSARSRKTLSPLVTDSKPSTGLATHRACHEPNRWVRSNATDAAGPRDVHCRRSGGVFTVRTKATSAAYGHPHFSVQIPTNTHAKQQVNRSLPGQNPKPEPSQGKRRGPTYTDGLGSSVVSASSSRCSSLSSKARTSGRGPNG